MKTKMLGLLVAGLLASAAASATTWNFGNYGTGDLGASSKVFSSDGLNLSVMSLAACTGSAVGSTCSSSQVDLWKKSGGVGETGLGLANDPEHEILATYGLGISLLIPHSADATYSFTLGSLASRPGKPESASVVEYGSNGVVSVLATLTGGADVQSTGWLTLANADDHFALIGNNVNVLLESVTAKVPEPADLGLLGLGLVGAMVARRRK